MYCYTIVIAHSVPCSSLMACINLFSLLYLIFYNQLIHMDNSIDINMSACIQQPILYRSVFSQQMDPTLITIIVLSTLIPIQLFCFIFICLYNRHNKKFTIQPQNDQNENTYQHLQKDKNNDHRMTRNRNSKVKVKDGKQYESNNAHKFENSNRFLKANSKSNNDQKIRSNNLHKYSQYAQEQHRKQAQNAEDKNTKSCMNKIISKIEGCVNSNATKNKIKLCAVVSVIFMVFSVVFLMVSVIASQQALNRQFPAAECLLNQTTSNFVNGNANWTGLSYIVPNLTKLQLNLNTRVKATKNSLTSLLLNGTNATFPIGFPNATRVFNVITMTNVVTNSVQSYIQAQLRQWLIRNSSLSGPYQFPICQTSTISNIPHPLTDSQTIQLNYMGSICRNLTEQVNSLVANGRAADQLLTHATSVENTRSLLNANLGSYNSSTSPIALRSQQYSQQFSSTNISVSAQRSVPIILLTLSLICLIFLIAYFIFQYRRFNKYIQTREDFVEIYNQDDPENPHKYKNMKIKVSNRRIKIEAENISVSDNSQYSPEQLRLKKQAKIKQLLRSGLFASSKFTHVINILFLSLIVVIGFSTISFNYFISTNQSYCSSFSSLLSGQSVNSISLLSANQAQLLTPIQSCIVSSAVTDRFLQTSDTPSQISSMQQLYKMSSIYNSSTPTNVLNSISLQQIEILKNYLLHMETMPIKSQDFNIQTILDQLNTYTNGSSTLSRQRAECGASVLRDQYVYNVQDCQYTLISYQTQSTITEPRCLQVPTYDGSGGSKDADLNDAQHTIDLNTTCPTIFQFFNGTNAACFLGKRLAVLQNANCTTTATQYNRRLKNLIKFSVQTASYTNSYLQNLRNYFGVYSVLSTNMTQFFNGVNTSSILNQFGTLSNNLINKTSCSYVKSAVNNVYDKFCPESDSIGMLLYDCYIWIFITFGFVTASWFTLLLWQISAKAFMRAQLQSVQANQFEVLKVNIPRKFFKNNQIINQAQHKNEHNGNVNRKIKRMQLSEQTLKDENNEEEQNTRRFNIMKNNIDQQSQIENYNYENKYNEKKIKIQIKEPDNSQRLKPRQKLEIYVQKEKQQKQEQKLKQEGSNSRVSERQSKKTELNEAKYEKQINETQKKLIKNTEQNKFKVNQTEQMVRNTAANKFQKQLGNNAYVQHNQSITENNNSKEEIPEQNTLQKELIRQNIFDTRFQDERKTEYKAAIQKIKRRNQKGVKSNSKNHKVLNMNEFSEPEQVEQPKKSKRFFQSIQTQDMHHIIKKDRSMAERKVKSKLQGRQQKKNKNMSSVVRLSKQARQNERLKAVELNQIVKQTIDVINIKQNLQDPFQHEHEPNQ